MSRFEYAFEDSDGAVPVGLWQATLSRSLGSRRGQEALAELEEALVALPECKLIEGHLAAEGQVCAVGAYVAHRRAKAEGTSLEEALRAMAPQAKCECGHPREDHEHNGCGGTGWGGRGCYCRTYEPDYEDVFETAEAGHAAGLAFSVAWHLAYLNDQTFGTATPEERYERMLAWVRRALGKEAVAA